MVKIFFAIWFCFFNIQPIIAMEFTTSETDLITSQQSLNLAILTEFREIVKNYYNRLNDARTKPKAEAVKILAQGFWYANDYYDLLIRHNQTTRLNWLKEQDRDGFYNGFVSKNNALELKGRLSYYLKHNANIAKIVLNFGNDLIFIDCGMAYQLAYYRAALKMLGEEKFNHYFGSSHKAFISHDINNINLSMVIEYEKFSNTPGEIGTNFYIANHILYNHKEYNGEAQGFNLLVAGNNIDGNTLFIGLGLPSEGLTATQIKEILVDNFNQDPYNSNIVSSSSKFKKPTDLMLELMCFLSNKKIKSVDDQEIFDEIKIHFLSKIEEKAILFNLSPEEMMENFIQHISNTYDQLEEKAAPFLSFIKLKNL